MAVTVDQYGPFDGTPAYEDFWREMMKHAVNNSSSGVIRGFGNDFLVYGDSTGMQVKVDTGEAWLRGHFAKSTSVKTLPIASNATGSTRKDLVVLRADFVNNRVEVDVITGTTTAPTPTTNSAIWETALGVVSVPNGAVTITAGNVAASRTYTTVAAKYIQTTPQTLSSTTYATMTFQGTELETADVVLNTSHEAQVKRAGVWLLTASCGFQVAGTNTGHRRVVLNSPLGTQYARSESTAPGGSTQDTYTLTSCTAYLNVGDYVRVRLFHNQSGNVDTASSSVTPGFLALNWLGP